MTLSLKVTIKDTGCAEKKGKRCIPEEGMPHAHKACQKEKEEEKDNPYPRKKRKKREKEGSCK
jgi:hypothetical protein